MVWGRGTGMRGASGLSAEGVRKKTDHYLPNTSMTATIDGTDTEEGACLSLS